MRISLDATERRALTLATFASACICFAPAEIISGVLLLVASMALHRWDQKLTAREALEAKAAEAGAPAGPPAGPSAVPTDPA